MASIHHAPEIDGNDPFPVLDGDVAHESDGDNTCVVDQDVHFAPGIEAVVCHSHDVIELGDIAEEYLSLAS